MSRPLSGYRKMVFIDHSELERLRQRDIQEFDPHLRALSKLKGDMDNAIRNVGYKAPLRAKLYQEAKIKFDELNKEYKKMRTMHQQTEVPELPAAQPDRAEHGNLVSPDPPTRFGESLPSRRNNDDYTTPDSSPSRNGNVRQSIAESHIITPSALDESSAMGQKETDDEDTYEIGTYLKKAYLEIGDRSSLRLFRSITDHKDVIDVNSSDQLIVNGKLIRGSNFIPLIRAFYSPDKPESQIGKKALLSAFSQLGIQPSIFPSNSAYKRDYERILSHSNESLESVRPPTPRPSSTSSVTRSQSQKGKGPPGKRIRLIPLR
jgi:hypothetical protein